MSKISEAKKWIEKREQDLAKSVLKYKLSKEGRDHVDDSTLDSGAEKVVSEANRIVKEKGKEVVSDISRGVGSFIKRVKGK